MSSINGRTFTTSLTNVESALVKQWKKDNPGLVDAPMLLTASQIRAAAQTQRDSNDSRTSNRSLAKVLEDLASKLENNDRTLDINGDGKLEVTKGFMAVTPGQDLRTELDKYAKVTDLTGVNGNTEVSTTNNNTGSNNSNNNSSSNTLSQFLKLFLGLLSGGLGNGNSQSGLGGGNILILLLTLLLGKGQNN